MYVQFLEGFLPWMGEETYMLTSLTLVCSLFKPQLILWFTICPLKMVVACARFLSTCLQHDSKQNTLSQAAKSDHCLTRRAP